MLCIASTASWRLDAATAGKQLTAIAIADLDVRQRRIPDACDTGVKRPWAELPQPIHWCRCSP
jgi:hypothetical protein